MGLTQSQRFMTAGVVPRPHLPLVSPGGLTKGHVAHLSFCNCRRYTERCQAVPPLNQ
jgi:hypothetical protein